MDAETQNKIDSREGIFKLFYHHHYDFLRQLKVGKVALKNIITSYYQITEVFKSALSIRHHTGNKDDRK